MKTFAHCLAVIFLGIPLSFALSLEELQVSYQSAVLKTNEARDQQIGKLDERYLEVIGNLKESAQKEGDLEKALAVQKEADLISKKTWPLEPLPEDIESTLGRVRTTYLTTRVGIEREWALATTTLAEKMEVALDLQVTNLTKSGDLEEARKARKLLEAIVKDPEVIKAKELPGRISSSGRSRAGYRIRRNGDDLEVLVRYDSDGKISLKSTIENVVEITGGKREKGKTEAKTLGEFVGAEGFETKPYVALRHTPDDGEIKFSDVVGVGLKFVVNEGTELTITPTANNAYLAVNGLLSATPATYCITSELKIPSGNKALKGLFFRQGGSQGTVIGKPVIGNGEWQAVTCEGAGDSQEDFLRIHFSGFALKDYPKARGDRVILKTLQVEYVRFSAHIVEAFGKSGETAVTEAVASQQKLLVQNGMLLAQ